MTQRAKAAAIANDAEAGAAAEEVLAAKGSAVDAVLAGFFSLAGRHPGALAAPAVALVGGAGAGSRAFDGRAQQPGAGAARPRGTVAGEAPPFEARAATPRAAHMAVLMHASYGRRSLREIVRAGSSEARGLGASRRSALLGQIGEGGMQALAKSAVTSALLRAAGANAGGQLTEEDLATAQATNEPARVVAATDDLKLVLEPWPSAGSARVHAIAAVDAWGLAAVLASFDGASDRQLVVPELEIALPTVAEPVMRGKPRVAPRTILPVPARISLVDGGASLRAAVVFASDAPSPKPPAGAGVAPSTWLEGWKADFAVLSESALARPWRRS